MPDFTLSLLLIFYGLLGVIYLKRAFVMPVSFSHRRQLLFHSQREQQQQITRANAIFELVSVLAQARNEVVDPELRSRIERALLQSHIALEGFVPVDLPANVVRLSQAAR